MSGTTMSSGMKRSSGYPLPSHSSDTEAAYKDRNGPKVRKHEEEGSPSFGKAATTTIVVGYLIEKKNSLPTPPGKVEDDGSKDKDWGREDEKKQEQKTDDVKLQAQAPNNVEKGNRGSGEGESKMPPKTDKDKAIGNLTLGMPQKDECFPIPEKNEEVLEEDDFGSRTDDDEHCEGELPEDMGDEAAHSAEAARQEFRNDASG